MPRTLGRVLAFTSAIVLASAASAAASNGAVTPTTTTTTTTTSTTTTTTPVPAPPKPKRGSLRLFVYAYAVHSQLVTIPGRGVDVDGVVNPYVPGQWVTLKVFLGHKLIKTKQFRVKPSPKHNYGRFSYSVSSPGVGTVSVKVTHERTQQMLGFNSARTFAALDSNVGFGSTGPFVDLIQQRLAALHFYIPQTGVYDGGMGLAIDAYHRLLHWGTYQTLDSRTITWLLNGWGQFQVRYPGNGMHAEGNLSVQLLALINGSQVQYIFPISSGKPSTPTILGNFRIYQRTPGYLPDGMYYSSFFIGGYAIHGYNPAPDYPASHGCMRLPIVDAIFVFNWLTYNDWVDTYY